MTSVEIALGSLFLATVSFAVGFCIWDYRRVGTAMPPPEDAPEHIAGRRLGRAHTRTRNIRRRPMFNRPRPWDGRGRRDDGGTAESLASRGLNLDQEVSQGPLPE